MSEQAGFTEQTLDLATPEDRFQGALDSTVELFQMVDAERNRAGAIVTPSNKYNIFLGTCLLVGAKMIADALDRQSENSDKSTNEFLELAKTRITAPTNVTTQA